MPQDLALYFPNKTDLIFFTDFLDAGPLIGYKKRGAWPPPGIFVRKEEATAPAAPF